MIVGGFSEVSGLSVEIDTEDVKEGGVNDHSHKVMKGAKHENITLKRGLTDSDVMWKWINDAVTKTLVNRKFKRKSGRIILYDSEGNEKWFWLFEDAIPVKWTGPDFKADSGAAAIETLVLAHDGLKKG